MFTVHTQIPTALRGYIRSIVKAHSDWQAFIAAKGLISANARNADLLEFALMHPALAQQVDDALTTDRDTNTEYEREDTEMETSAEAEAPAAPAEAPAGAFDLDTVLAGVEPFLAPLVRKELSAALAPVITAANKPPVEKIVEIDRIIEVAPGEGPRIAAAPKARRDRQTTFRTLFPNKAKDEWRDRALTLWTGAVAPAVDPFYVVDHEQMATFLTAIERGTNVWFTGPSASGKSTLPGQGAATMGRPFVKIAMTRQTEVSDLVGGMALRNGSTVWEDGVLIAAMRQPGTIILLDELTFAPAGVQAIFQAITDNHRTYTLPTGEVVKCADGVVFVVADNTAGAGDEGGLYAGTNVSNVALVTRFGRMVIMDYLTPQREAEALANHTACPVPAARHLSDLVAQARRLPALAGVIVSLRQMVAFVQMVQDGFSSKSAFLTTISGRMPATERAAMEALVDLAFHQNFEALVRGKPVPAAPSNSPAAKAFGDVANNEF